MVRAYRRCNGAEKGGGARTSRQPGHYQVIRSVGLRSYGRSLAVRPEWPENEACVA